MNTQYYICSHDVIPHLHNIRYRYVFDEWEYFTDANKRLIKHCGHESSGYCNIADPFIDYADVLVENLSNELLTFLSLTCKSIKICNYDDFSIYLKESLHMKNHWIKT